MFTHLEAGASPDALGLVYVASAEPDLAQTYWESCGETGRPYADELLGRMSEHDHAWALALAVARVEDRDPRSLDTIAQQRLTWCVPVLEEIAARDAREAPHFRDAMNVVLSALLA